MLIIQTIATIIALAICVPILVTLARWTFTE